MVRDAIAAAVGARGSDRAGANNVEADSPLKQFNYTMLSSFALRIAGWANGVAFWLTGPRQQQLARLGRVSEGDDCICLIHVSWYCR